MKFSVRTLGWVLLILGFVIQVLFVIGLKQLVPMLVESRYQTQILKFPSELISKVDVHEIIHYSTSAMTDDMPLWLFPSALMLAGGLILGLIPNKK